MPLDSFICGQCETVFHSIEDFVTHKTVGCSGHTEGSIESSATIVPHKKNEEQESFVIVKQDIDTSEPQPQLVQNTNTGVDVHSGTILEQVGNYSAPTLADNNTVVIEEARITDREPLVASDATVQDFISYSSGVDGQTTYSYVLTKDQLAQLGIQSDGDVIGEYADETGDPSQVTVMLTQPLQEVLNMDKNPGLTDPQYEFTEVVDSNTPQELPTSDTSTCIQLLPMEADGLGAHAIVVKTKREIHEEMVIKQKQELREKSAPGVKKRGRPKKTETAKKTSDVSLPEPVETQKKPPPEIDAEGRLSCKVCQKAFNKERHYNTHRCISWGDYIDINKKESIDNLQQDSGEEDTDKTRDFTWSDYKRSNEKGSLIRATRIVRQPLQLKVLARNAIKGESQKSLSLPNNMDASISNETKGSNSKVHEMEDDIEKTPRRKKNQVYDDKSVEVDSLPIFTNEQDKLAFDAAMNVDLSFVDDLYSTHQIEQDVKADIAPSIHFRSSKALNTLTVYTCNECKRVFMSQSHCRLHCVSHTDAKPFRCIKCDYSTNAKGHLYTHIRQHTGQLYKCSKCSFSTGNKTHLVEHEETHVNAKQQCAICRKHYSTKKSLINHIRLYHTNAQGQEYIMQFMKRGPRNKVSMLHHCDICNRKFKKRIDRDRHLFCHNVTNIPCLYTCDLCTFSTYRQSYLDKHFLRHKIVFSCVICQQKFPSSIRLNDHLSVDHNLDDSNASNNYGYDSWRTVFDRCIEASLYQEDALTQGVVEVEKVPAGDEYHYVTKEPSLTTATKYFGAEAENRDQNAEAANVGDKTQNTSIDPSVPLENSAHNEEPLTARITIHSKPLTPPHEVNYNFMNQPIEQLENNAPNEKQNMFDVRSDKTVTVLYEGNQNTNEHSQNAKENDLIVRQMGFKDDQVLENSQSEITGNDVMENSQQADKSGGIIEEAFNMPDPGDEDEADDEEDVENNPPPPNQIPPAEAKRTLYQRLQYKPLSVEIFYKLREIYGREECEYCGRLFYSKTDYAPHLQMHMGEKPFACEQCDYKAVTKGNLKRHVQREHEQVIFKCSACEFEGSCRTQLWTHQKQMHSGLTAVCNVCKEEFPDFKVLKAHLSIKHQELKPEEKYKMIYPTSRSQLQIGRRVYKCPHCDKTFLRAYADFQKHLWMHEGIKPFKCTVCPYSCRSQTNLNSHMLRHSNEKPFLCNVCGKAYKSKTALRWHERSHKYGRGFKCTKCDYSALQKAHLIRHMQIHDVIKVCRCALCDYSTNTPGAMKVHYARAHKGQVYEAGGVGQEGRAVQTLTDPNTKVFKCATCEYLFGTFADLKRHLRQRHGAKDADIANITHQPIVSSFDVIQENVVNTQPLVQDMQGIEMENGEPGSTTTLCSADGMQFAISPDLLSQLVNSSKESQFGQGIEFAVETEGGQVVSIKPLTQPILQQTIHPTQQIDNQPVILEHPNNEIPMETEFEVAHGSQEHYAPNNGSIQEVIMESGSILMDDTSTENNKINVERQLNSTLFIDDSGNIQQEIAGNSSVNVDSFTSSENIQYLLHNAPNESVSIQYITQEEMLNTGKPDQNVVILSAPQDSSHSYFSMHSGQEQETIANSNTFPKIEAVPEAVNGFGDSVANAVLKQVSESTLIE